MAAAGGCSKEAGQRKMYKAEPRPIDTPVGVDDASAGSSTGRQLPPVPCHSLESAVNSSVIAVPHSAQFMGCGSVSD